MFKIFLKKIDLIKTNPTHFKRINGYPLPLHRIRIKNKRIIYTTKENNILFLFIIDRKYDYKEIPKYLQDLGYL
jgi:mRNA-degrading endonuclease RelE of RelBE toxin-antitoxin system